MIAHILPENRARKKRQDGYTTGVFGDEYSKNLIRLACKSDITQVIGRAQCLDRVTFRDKLLSHKACIPAVLDGSYDGRVIEFLGIIQILPSGVARSVDVSNIGAVGADGADRVAFHDLHVVNIVQKLYCRGIDQVHHQHTPGGVIALVIIVIDFRIQQFHNQGHTFRGGSRRQALEPGSSVQGAGFIAQAGPIA